MTEKEGQEEFDPVLKSQGEAIKQILGREGMSIKEIPRLLPAGEGVASSTDTVYKILQGRRLKKSLLVQRAIVKILAARKLRNEGIEAPNPEQINSMTQKLSLQVFETPADPAIDNPRKAELPADQSGGAAAHVRKQRNPLIVGDLSVTDEGYIGRQQLLDDLSDFIIADKSAVFTLFGLGGCGKSATLVKLLKGLGVNGDTELASKVDGIFGWGFYGNTDTESFFKQLTAYVRHGFVNSHQRDRHDSADNPLLLPETFRSTGDRILVVLDGLERIQEPSDEPGSYVGTLHNPALRSLLQAAARGDCGNTKVLITSRLLVREISAKQHEFSFEADLNRMTDDDAKLLLQSRGVHLGPINTIAAEFRYHAYSLRLLGDIIAAEYGGDARRRDRILQPGLSKRGDMGRILRWHSEHLPSDCALCIKALSVFRDRATNGQVQELIPLISSNRSDTPQVFSRHRSNQALERLKTMGLVFEGERASSSETFFSLHPIVRDYFYASILNPKDVHERVAKILQSPVPGYSPSASIEMESLIEMIYHGVKSGDFEAAYHVYRQRMGGYPKLGTRRGEHSIGAKAVFTILDEQNTEADPELLYRLYLDGALFLKNEGRLEDSIDLVQTALTRPEVAGPERNAGSRTTLLLNLSGVQVLRGKVAESIDTAKQARSVFSELETDPADHEWVRKDKECDSRLAVALGFSDPVEALKIYDRIRHIPDSTEKQPREYDSVRHAWLLNNMGRLEEAKRIISGAKPFAEDLSADMIVQRMNSQLALSEIRLEQQKPARDLIDEISKWATKTDFHIFVQSWVLESEFCLRFGTSTKAYEMARKGAKYAGENGFTAEWIDLVLLQAEALLVENANQAFLLAERALSGDTQEYGLPVFGAMDPTTNYLFAECTARLIKAKALGILGEDDKRSDSLTQVVSLMSKIGHYRQSEAEALCD